MLEAMPVDGGSFCTACFNGEYPVPVDPATGKLSLEEAACRSEKT
jgi:glutamine phosphoribosylpyrophosphate amidotransferase